LSLSCDGKGKKNLPVRGQLVPTESGAYNQWVVNGLIKSIPKFLFG